MSEQPMDQNPINEDANAIIANGVKWSAAAAIIPVPIVDLVALGGVQYKTIRDLAALYGISENEERIKSIVSASLASLAPSLISTGLVGSSLKLIPGHGTIFGSASLAAFSSAATFAIAKVFSRHFAKGGTIETFDVENTKKDIKEEFEAAKENEKPSKSGSSSKK